MSGLAMKICSDQVFFSKESFLASLMYILQTSHPHFLITSLSPLTVWSIFLHTVKFLQLGQGQRKLQLSWDEIHEGEQTLLHWIQDKPWAEQLNTDKTNTITSSRFIVIGISILKISKSENNEISEDNAGGCQSDGHQLCANTRLTGYHVPW